MKHNPFTGVAITVLSLVIWSTSTALSDEPPVRVRDVDFRQVTGSRAAHPYFQAAVEIEGEENPDPKARHPDYNDNILVRLWLAFKERDRSKYAENKYIWSYFRCEVTIATLKNNDHPILYFFIPPAVMERDDLSSRADAWLVEIEVEGKRLPLQKDNVSRNLRSTDAVADFKNRAFPRASQNDGILVPIYRTPFWAVNSDDGRLARSPDYVLK